MRAPRTTPHRIPKHTPKHTPKNRFPGLVAPIAALLCLTLAPASLSHAASGAAHTSTRVAPGAQDAPVQTWQADLSHVDADDAGVRHTKGALRTTAGTDDVSSAPSAVSAGAPGRHGTQVLAPHRIDHPADRFRAELDARVPDDARVAVDVRGRSGEGRWTEWREAGPDEAGAAVLPRAVTTVQVRLVLWDTTGGLAVRGLRLTADTAPGERRDQYERAGASAAPFTARVFATREGLVGHTTANGHVIRPDDHFVALPSRRGLSPRGTSDYSVRVCGPVRCETAPVWDVGPWNIHDDHWNPSSIRESFRDLPRGLPEAQAAYQDGYNGGLDGFGRRVLNPAGIDLADGTFHNVGLNDNGWVTVTYLWTGDQTGSTFPTWGSDVRVRQRPTTGSTVVDSLAGPTRVRVECQVHGETVTYDGHTNDAWAYLPDHGGYVSNIFIDVPEGWLPGVPTC
ncbi:hypothetical protein F0L17_18655 [Streptomyces sp. TRM43335]|uniref:Secreted protein n=1 Tax=Streptomyces taklimakanensis TaxID=2569853 RepID=A0A6G2BGS1_9ACTN|nr:SH3 domain-containing protein [Streptomyces taklimakanensis]MTE21102.1 hypothetical protein [Streptomyces taklimakanensis]